MFIRPLFDFATNDGRGPIEVIFFLFINKFLTLFKKLRLLFCVGDVALNIDAHEYGGRFKFSCSKASFLKIQNMILVLID